MPAAPSEGNAAVGVDRRSQLTGRVVESGLDRADRDADDVGNARDGHVEVVLQDKDRAVLGERRLNARSSASRLAISEVKSPVTAGSMTELAGRPRPPACPPRLRVTRADEEPMQPRFKAVGLPKPWQVPPGLEERLLDGVPRALLVAEDPERDRTAAMARDFDQLAERRVVTRSGPLDQPDLHPQDLMRAGSSGGYTLLVAMIAPEVQYLTSVRAAPVRVARSAPAANPTRPTGAFLVSERAAAGSSQSPARGAAEVGDGGASEKCDLWDRPQSGS